MEKKEHLYTVEENVKWCSHCGKYFAVPQKKEKTKHRITIGCCSAAKSCPTFCDPQELRCARLSRPSLSPCCCCWVASVVSNSVRPHRQQPTRIHRPWDSPGKNTGVGCHFLLQCMKREKWKWSHLFVSDSWQPHGLQPTRLLRPWDFPSKSTGVGSHCLLPLSP